MKQKLLLLCLMSISARTIAMSCSVPYATGPDAIVYDSAGDELTPAVLFTPTTLEELQCAISEAIEAGVFIRAFGGIHSFYTDVDVPNDGYLINMNSMNKILEINPSQMTITVMGGMNLYQLSHELAKVGMALIDQPGPYDATAAGMITNAVHESGLHGGPSDTVVAIQIIDGTNTLRTISSTENPQWLPIARVSLGALGVVYSVTYKCVPATNRHVVFTATTADELIPQINTLLHTTDNFQFLVDPSGLGALQQTFDITTDPVTPSSINKNYSKYLNESMASGLLGVVTTPLIPQVAYPAVNEAITLGTAGTDCVDFFYKGYSYFHANVISRSLISEVSLPAASVVPALQGLFNLVQEPKYKNQVLFACEVRYVQDEVFMNLSPYSRPTWSIGLIPIYPNLIADPITELPSISEQLLSDFTALMATFDCRPEWGNNPQFLTYNNPPTGINPFGEPYSQSTLVLYGQANVDQFNALRRQFDPNGLYYTSYFENILGPL